MSSFSHSNQQLPPEQLPRQGCFHVSLHHCEEMIGYLAMVMDQLQELGFSQRDQFGVRLSMEEAIVNALKHGNRSDPIKSVTIRHHISSERILVEITDEGNGFNRATIRDPLAEENLEREGGRGLLLIRCYTNWMHFNPKGNQLTLCKTRSRE